MEFDTAEERVLFRLATADRSESLIWFARRFSPLGFASAPTHAACKFCISRPRTGRRSASRSTTTCCIRSCKCSPTLLEKRSGTWTRWSCQSLRYLLRGGFTSQASTTNGHQTDLSGRARQEFIGRRRLSTYIGSVTPARSLKRCSIMVRAVATKSSRGNPGTRASS